MSSADWHLITFGDGSKAGPPSTGGPPQFGLRTLADRYDGAGADLLRWHDLEARPPGSLTRMCARPLAALVVAVLLTGSAGLIAGQVNTANVPAIQNTIDKASDNSQIADTSSQTVKTGAAVAPAATSLQQQAAPLGQNAAPAVPQAAQINNALLQASKIATQLLQAAPPVSS